MGPAQEILLRLEHCYDAIPRIGGARVEELGALVLFVPEGAGWPYYARPRLGTAQVRAADIDRVRARQRELAQPEAFEWVHDLTPSMSAAAADAGLSVLRAPLMVLDHGALPGPQTLADAEISMLDPDAPDFPTAYALGDAVAQLAFATGTPSGGKAGRDPDDGAGPAQRDAAAAVADPVPSQRAAAAIRAGHRAQVLASTPPEGVLATGALQLAAGAAEVVGVATLPAARRRGLGAAVSAALARLALDRHAEIVFLYAASEDVARMYRRIGFRRVGTACIAGPHPG